MKNLITISLITALLLGASAHAARLPVKTITTVLTGVAAAAFGTGAEFKEMSDDARTIADELKEKHPDLRNPSIYSFFFSVDNSLFSVSRWADINGSGADIFVKVSVEGSGSFIIPERIENYRGQNIILTTAAEDIPPNSKVILSVYDDDSVGNAIWNSLAQSKTTVRTGIESRSIYVAAKVSSNSEIRLLKTNEVLDKPDFLASVSFTTPSSKETRWTADGVIKDKFGKTAGSIQFSKCLSSRDLKNAETKYRKRYTTAFLTGGILLIVCFFTTKKIMKSNQRTPETN